MKKLLLIAGLVVAAIYIAGRVAVQFKDGVNTEGVKWPTWFALGIADLARKVAGGSGPLTVTSLTDSSHMQGSLHYQGLAADLRTNDLSAAIAQAWYALLKALLQPLGFDVIVEGAADAGSTGAHIHIEYQPKAGGGSLPFGG